MRSQFTPIQTAVLEEKQRLFFDENQLVERWEALSVDEPGCFVIAEIGFGNALQFLLAWFFWEKHAPPLAVLHFIAVEPHPFIRDDLARCLALFPTLHHQAQALLAAYPILTPGFHRMSFAAGRVTLTLIIGEVLASYQSLLVCGDVVLEPSLREWFVDAWFLNGVEPSAELQCTINLLSKTG